MAVVVIVVVVVVDVVVVVAVELGRKHLAFHWKATSSHLAV